MLSGTSHCIYTEVVKLHLRCKSWSVAASVVLLAAADFFPLTLGDIPSTVKVYFLKYFDPAGKTEKNNKGPIVLGSVSVQMTGRC